MLSRIAEYRRRDWPIILQVAAIYALLAKLVLTISTANGNVTIFWIPGGLALAALLVFGKKYWPGVYLGAVAAGLMVDDPIWVSLLLALGNTLETLLACYMLERIARFDRSLRRLDDFVALGLCGAVGSGVSAMIGPLTLWIAGYLSADTVLGNIVHWWQADSLGIVLGTPLFLIWRKRPKSFVRSDRKKIVAALVFVFVAFLVGQAVFLDWFERFIGAVSLSHWSMLFVVLAAVFFGRHGTSLIIGMNALQALQGAVTHRGLFAFDIEQTGLQNFWFFLLILSVVGYSLALTLEARQRTAALLQSSESKWHGLFTHMTNGFVLHEAVSDNSGRMIDFRFVEVNPAFEAMTQLSAADLIGWRFKDKFPDTDVDWIAVFKSVAESGRPAYVENYSAQLQRWFSSYMYRSGTHCVVELLQDITERKHLETELRQSEQRLTTILDSVSACIYMKDRDGRYLFVNRAIRELFGADATIAKSSVSATKNFSMPKRSSCCVKMIFVCCAMAKRLNSRKPIVLPRQDKLQRI